MKSLKNVLRKRITNRINKRESIPTMFVTPCKVFAMAETPEPIRRRKVGIVMGSPNDYAKMRDAEDVLHRFGIETRVRVMSAHRQPREVAEFASNARENGYSAMICGAGMAAHLAGVVSAHTTLPVVGVPLSGSAMSGLDALYSTVQMPKGIPVATVAIDNATNAGILVTQMFGITDPEMEEQVSRMREETRNAYNNIELDSEYSV